MWKPAVGDGCAAYETVQKRGVCGDSVFNNCIMVHFLVSVGGLRLVGFVVYAVFFVFLGLDDDPISVSLRVSKSGRGYSTNVLDGGCGETMSLWQCSRRIFFPTVMRTSILVCV